MKKISLLLKTIRIIIPCYPWIIVKLVFNTLTGAHRKSVPSENLQKKLDKVQPQESLLFGPEIKKDNQFAGLEAIETWNKLENQELEEQLRKHRFGLYLEKVSLKQMTKMEFQLICKDWIERNKIEPKAFGFDSYSLSERISNWIVFFHLDFRSKSSEFNDIKNSLVLQAMLLNQQLEFRGTSTNNHLLNNARALYLYGVTFDNKFLHDNSKLIIRFCIEKMFFNDGFLREGSSHYQLLMARTFLEILYFSFSYKDLDFYEEIKPFTLKVRNCAMLFLEDVDYFPYIGDISPDFSVDFHRDISKIGMNQNYTGWGTFFEFSKMLPFISDLSRSNSIEDKFTYSPSGFVRIKEKEFIFYTYINPHIVVPAWSHAHADLGSYILYIKKKMVVCSLGRAQYTNDDLSRFGRSTNSKNTILIGDKSPQLLHGLHCYTDLLPEKFVNSRNNLIVKIKKEPYRIKIISNFTNTLWERNFVFDNNKITIQDLISNEKLVCKQNLYLIPSFKNSIVNIECLENFTEERLPVMATDYGKTVPVLLRSYEFKKESNYSIIF